MSYNSGVIELAISKQPLRMGSSFLKSLARLFSDLYSTQSITITKWLVCARSIVLATRVVVSLEIIMSSVLFLFVVFFSKIQSANFGQNKSVILL